jgi:hypothetical protein
MANRDAAVHVKVAIDREQYRPVAPISRANLIQLRVPRVPPIPNSEVQGAPAVTESPLRG